MYTLRQYAVRCHRRQPVAAGPFVEFASRKHHVCFSTNPLYATASNIISRVGIVGAGPSGFYVAKYLLKELGPGATVDVMDSLPTPFGLVRTGVAPDHPEVKAVQSDFEKVAGDPRFSFYRSEEHTSELQSLRR